MRKIKIKIFGEHLAYINIDLLNTFQQTQGIIDIKPWILEMIEKDFDIRINTLNKKEQILLLQSKVQSLYYDSIGEWLQEKLRNSLK